MAEALEQDRNRGQIRSDDRARLYTYLARDYNQLGEPQVAIDWAHRWVESDLMNFRSSTTLAGLYIWNGDYEEAFRVLQRVEPLGGHSDLLFSGSMGRIYESRGEWDLAIEEYREFWAQAKDVEWARPYAAWYLGTALYDRGRVDEARVFLEIVQHSGNLGLSERAAALLLQSQLKGKP